MRARIEATSIDDLVGCPDVANLMFPILMPVDGPRALTEEQVETMRYNPLLR